MTRGETTRGETSWGETTRGGNGLGAKRPGFCTHSESVGIEQVRYRALTRILKIGVKMAPSRKSWSFTIHLYWNFSKSWSQIQKVGVNYSKFGVNESSAVSKVYG